MFVLPEPETEKFWSVVDKSGGPNACWPWAGLISNAGYGMFQPRGQQPRTAHRVAWQLTHGQELTRLEYVCHACDNPPCCNPRHLWIGSPRDNVRDARKKGRLNGLKGHLKTRKPKPSDLPIIPVRVSKHAKTKRTKLNADQVLEIRQRRKAGEMVRVLAAEYGITPRSVLNVVKGMTWA